MKCRCGYEGRGDSGIEKLNDLVIHMQSEDYKEPMRELRMQILREISRERRAEVKQQRREILQW